MRPPAPLPREFYLQDTVDVARALLGCVLWRKYGREWLAVRIVETEAYLGVNDAASHARRGHRSQRNESMYLDGGHAYVYMTYGMHYCVNVVTQEDWIPEAVLLRGGEPLSGIETMRSLRGGFSRDRDIASGPAKLTQAMAIDRALDAASLGSDVLRITPRDRDVAESEISVSARIGVEGAPAAAHWPLRFFFAGNPHVSPGRPAGSFVPSKKRRSRG
ncbi:MAG: DNA-3-methyladenine glycosylase [Acidobacteria bacterium]|nr:DNA-3-methyladenine glycosylase [Acidobacteriota bacterium]